MRYHYKKPDEYENRYGQTYICDHPIYNRCTLYKIDNRGLAVIQQRFQYIRKSIFWTEIDPWLIDQIYLHEKFNQIFMELADICRDGLYPTITVRKLMWALRMKPLPKEQWETTFDRRMV